MRSLRLPLRAALATMFLTAAAVVGLTSAGGVSAMEQPTVVVRWDQESTTTFGPILGQNAVLPTAVADPNPAQCRAIAVPAVGFCDVVPVEVILPPDYDEFKTYAYTVITLVWEADPTGEGANDLDMYVYNEDEEQVSSSATSSNPEQAKTESQKFFIVVNNFSGAAPDYTIRLKVFLDTIEKPFELLEPEVAGDGFGLPTGSSFIDSGPGAGGFGVPMDDSAIDGSSAVGGGGGSSGTLGKIELVPAPDRTVDIDFDAIQREVAAAEEAAADAPASSGPGAGVWFWLVLLPIALIASAGAWFVTRRPASLKR